MLYFSFYVTPACLQHIFRMHFFELEPYQQLHLPLLLCDSFSLPFSLSLI